jgi:hypothetical protein
MALKKGIQLQNGLNIENAYLRIDRVSGNKQYLDIWVNAYISIEAYQQGKDTLQTFPYKLESPQVDDDSPNFIKQGYEYIKTLPEYAEAEDC